MDGCEAGDSESLQRDSSRVTRLTLMEWRGTPVLCKVHVVKRQGSQCLNVALATTFTFPLFLQG